MKMRGSYAAIVAALVMVVGGGCADGKLKAIKVNEPGGMISAVPYLPTQFDPQGKPTTFQRRYKGRWKPEDQAIYRGDEIDYKAVSFPGAGKYFHSLHFLLDGKRVGRLVEAREFDSGDPVVFRLTSEDTKKLIPGHVYSVGVEVFNRERPLSSGRRGMVLGSDIIPIVFLVEDETEDPIRLAAAELFKLQAEVVRLSSMIRAGAPSTEKAELKSQLTDLRGKLKRKEEEFKKIKDVATAVVTEAEQLREQVPPDVTVKLAGREIDPNKPLSVKPPTIIRFESADEDYPADRYVVELLRDGKKLDGGEFRDKHLNLSISKLVPGVQYDLRVLAYRGSVAREISMTLN